MTLVRDAGEFASWFWKATRRLVQVDRRAAWRLILSKSVNQIVTVIVFFLPLKIVLLIASDGVPKYFKFFISQDTKAVWLGGLAVAIFVLYIVSLRLDTIAARSAGRGARSLVSAGHQVPVTTDPEDFARTTFYRIGETSGGLVFSIAALAGGALIFPSFFFAIPVLLVLEFAAVDFVCRDYRSSLSKVGYYVRERPLDLLRYLQEINFLIAFGLLLVFFLLFEDLNPLLGIAAIMLSRRVFGALKNVVQDSIKLSRDRRLVDALLFVNARVKVNPGTDRVQLLGNALPSARVEKIRRLAQTRGSEREIEVYADSPSAFELLESVEDSVWIDSGHIRTAVFDLYGTGETGSRERLFRDYVYSGKAWHGLEQHDYLLKFLDPEQLRCPSRVLGYRYNGLVGRIVDFRGMSDPSQNEWQTRREEVLQHLWSLEVPASLVAAYDSAHPRLEERLRSELLGPLAVAADEPWAQSTYELLASRLSRLCERVAELPVMLFNERLRRRNVVTGPDGGSRVLSWTSWSLQPLGAGFVPDFDSCELLDGAVESARIRSGVGDPKLVNDVVLGALLQRMDWLVKDGYPKGALSVAFAMLAVVDQPDGPNAYELLIERSSKAESSR